MILDVCSTFEQIFDNELIEEISLVRLYSEKTDDSS